MPKITITTPNAPAAIGPYAQAIQVGDLVFTSGQIGLDPSTGEMVEGDVAAQARQAFANLLAVAQQAGGSLQNAVKLTLYLTDLSHFATVNQIMAELVPEPFPARSTVGVLSLPRGGLFEVEAILAL